MQSPSGAAVSCYACAYSCRAGSALVKGALHNLWPATQTTGPSEQIREYQICGMGTQVQVRTTLVLACYPWDAACYCRIWRSAELLHMYAPHALAPGKVHALLGVQVSAHTLAVDLRCLVTRATLLHT